MTMTSASNTLVLLAWGNTPQASHEKQPAPWERGAAKATWTLRPATSTIDKGIFQ